MVLQKWTELGKSGFFILRKHSDAVMQACWQRHCLLLLELRLELTKNEVNGDVTAVVSQPCYSVMLRHTQNLSKDMRRLKLNLRYVRLDDSTHFMFH